MTMEQTDRYTVERTSHKGRPAWIVRAPDGRIANEHYHDTPGGARQHCEVCNAFARPGEGEAPL